MVRLETNMPVELRITKMTFLLETDDTVETVAVKLKNRPRSQLRNRYQARTVHFSTDLVQPLQKNLTCNPKSLCLGFMFLF